MMMAYGDFIFELRTLPYQSKQRSSQQRLPEQRPIGAAPIYQNLGRGEETITLSGVLYPELTGGEPELNTLRAMQSTGNTEPLIDGQGFVYGLWFIESINETYSEFFADGTAKKIEFELSLRNSFDDEPEQRAA